MPSELRSSFRRGPRSRQPAPREGAPWAALLFLLVGCAAVAPRAAGQAAGPAASSSDLVAQVRELRRQVRELQREVEQLRRAMPAGGAAASSPGYGSVAGPAPAPASAPPTGTTAPAAPLAALAAAGPGGAPARPSVAQRLEGLEESESLTRSQLADQAQEKVESGSKYRVRLTGLMLANFYGNQGAVDNQDFPAFAADANPLFSSHTVGGSLRQSVFGLDAFGPTVAGARSSASVRFDFAGGLPPEDNGAVEGLARLRTATARLDWSATSLVAGQDYLFIAPLRPSSLAALAQPPLAYAGDLWAWAPQVRLERRFALGARSDISAQVGLLDSLSGDVPRDPVNRTPSWGEQSGQPAYAAHVGYARSLGGTAQGTQTTLKLGAGGYFARQYWGYGREVNAWAVTADAALPLAPRWTLSGAMYRGRGVGGIGGGVGQTVLLSGALSDPATTASGLDAAGGWAQLQFRPNERLSLNGAIGTDQAFAAELRRFPNSPGYDGELLTRNTSPFVNFIYQARSDVLISAEYRWLRTESLTELYRANHLDLTLGYLF